MLGRIKKFTRISTYMLFVGSFLLGLSGLVNADEFVDVRGKAIDQAMNCIEQNITQEGEVSWNDVCYWTDSHTNSDSFKETSNKRLNKVNQELDDWEEIEHRHKNLFNENDKPASRNIHSKFDQPDQKLIDDRYARENVDGSDVDKHQMNLSWEVFRAKYEEPDVMHQKGVMNGISGLYAYRPNQNDVLYLPALNVYRLEGLFAWGGFNYESIGQNVTNGKDDFMYEIRGILGKEYVHRDYDLMVYSGFGHRYLNDDDNGELHIVGNTGFYGYERESRYYYIPIGFEISKDLEQDWSMKVKGEYDWFLFGRQKSHLSDGNKFLTSLNEDISNKQNSGYGLRGSFELAKSFEETRVFVEPFVRYWNIEDSEVVTAIVQGSLGGFLEPENSTFESGVKVGVQF